MIDLITYLKSLNIYNIILYLICFTIFFIINFIVLIEQIDLNAEAVLNATFFKIIFIEFIFVFSSIIITNIIYVLNYLDNEIMNFFISMLVGSGLSFCIAFIKFLKIYLRR